MLAGFARRDITPRTSYELAGYDLRTEKCDGVLDELYVSALALVSDAGEHFLQLSFDLLGVPSDLCAELGTLLSGKLGICEESILIQATHTHAAPRAAFVIRRAARHVERRHALVLVPYIHHAVELFLAAL